MSEKGETAGRTLYINNLNERIPHRVLNKELMKLCEQFAKPLNVYTSRAIRKRGQAFVTFKENTEAELVLHELRNRPFFSKEMRVSYAHSDSDVSLDDAGRSHRTAIRHQKLREKAQSNKNTNAVPDSDGLLEHPVPAAKLDFGEPHNVLLLQQIPDTVNIHDLQSACSAFRGYIEARMLAVKHVGFIDFDSTDSATAAITEISKLGLGKVVYAKK